ncbi:glyoxylate/hydroxypyruvate reductase A [Marinomonas ostreistagni]|nr:glyoxylate/hydroxypyruvate reductase A [Marinomonas ostreistagni]
MESFSVRAAIPFVSQENPEKERVWLETLSKYLPDEAILPLDKLSEGERQLADVAIVANPDPQALKQLPNLVWVHSVWAGVERLVNDLSEQSFSIVRLVDPQLQEAMAEAVQAWSLYLHRDMFEYAKLQRQATWQPLPYVPASARTIGVLGLGELGRASAERLLATGFNVIGWSRNEKIIDQVTTYTGDEGLETVLKSSDIVVCLLPLTKDTRGLLGFEALAMMQPGACIINFARGDVIDEEALQYALNTGQLKHAVLDVFAIEPLPKSHPFWTHPNITVLPHISAQTNIDSACQIVAQNIRNYRLLNLLPDVVDTKRGY